jgi:glycosyltransferase involved in cell wall biosynthesis
MDLPALNELVVDGVTGWLLPPDVADWVNLIDSLCRNPEKIRLAAGEALKRSSLYSAALHARRVENLYGSILG